MARFYHSPQQVVLYSFTHGHMFVDLWLDFLLLNTQGLADLSGSQHFPPLFDIYSSSNFKYYLWCAIFTVLPLPSSLPQNPTVVTSPRPHPMFRLCVCVRKYHEVKHEPWHQTVCVDAVLQCNGKDGCSNNQVQKCVRNSF